MSSTTIAIHQPNFLPWLGYFHKIANCDRFVLLDNVEYTKNSFINRNRIKTARGLEWIGMPVKYSGRSRQAICTCEIDQPKRNATKFLKTIETNYSKAPNYSKVFASLVKEISGDELNLSELNERLLKWAMSSLYISTPLVRASTLELPETHGTERLVDICKALEAEVYLAGFGAKKYQDDGLFEKAEIKIKTSNFEHPTYPQLFGAFEPNLSVLDYLMNCS